MANGGVPLEYWLQWQVFLCAIIFILPTIISIKFILTKNPQTHTIGYHHLWMPCWNNLHPLWLLVFRFFSFVSMAWLLYQTVMSFGIFVFYFYTQWTFLLVTIYFALGTIISAHGCWMHSKEHGPPNQERDKFLKKDSSPKVNEASQHNHTQVNQEAGFWGNLMQNLYQTCAGAVVLTDIVFWCLLLPFQTGDNFKLTLLIGCMHSVNAVFLLLDSALNSLQFSWLGLTYFILWSSTYIVFQWVMHACCFKWWPYPFLELDTPWAPMWYFGIALFHLPCYGVFVWLVKAKVSMFSKMFPRAFIRMVANEKQM
uniref:Transmembrane protein n=1 Tax=Tanacetum cinerariifolium TaxID=118510 RepID=A0A6L2K6K1_TANCI|nr:hypothetical protein CTI12_AA038770 [Tanacetum cinerariifolium]